LSDELIRYTAQIFSPSFIIDTLKQNNLSLKKSMGQNLLINHDLATRIIQYAEIKGTDRVLEIGPGLGTMTFLLAEYAEQVIAVEIDAGFVRFMKGQLEKFELGNIVIIHGDILNRRIEELVARYNPNKVVSNFPYRVAMRALVRIAEGFWDVDRITGTVQRELGERITAIPGKKEYSAVSVYLQYLTNTTVVQKRISPQNFFPVPEVESSIVDIKRLNRRAMEEINFFRDVVRIGFSGKRKQLIKNLQGLPLVISKDEIERIVEELFNDRKIRAERLSVDDFRRLAETLRVYHRNDERGARRE
jgi:16S rRNA (adenine1518-N6/adenine1519-N6)-dimethyltransferase